VRGWIAVTAFVAAVLIGGATRAETLEAQMQALLDRFHAEYGCPPTAAMLPAEQHAEFAEMALAATRCVQPDR